MDDQTYRLYLSEEGVRRRMPEWVVYDGGHSAPRTQRIKESLAWLDRCLEP